MGISAAGGGYAYQFADREEHILQAHRRSISDTAFRSQPCRDNIRACAALGSSETSCQAFVAAHLCVVDIKWRPARFLAHGACEHLHAEQ